MGVVKCSWMEDAKKLCPSLVLVNGEDLAEYRRYSQKIFELIKKMGKGLCPVERLGMDENFIDVSNLGKPKKFNQCIIDGYFIPLTILIFNTTMLND